MAEKLPYSVWFPIRNEEDIKAYPDNSFTGSVIVKDDSMDYKEGENKIGTYLGKDLYRYVSPSYIIPEDSGELNELADISNLNIDEIINLKVRLLNTKRFAASNSTTELSLTYDYSTKKLMVYSFGNEYDNELCVVIIEYTKE